MIGQNLYYLNNKKYVTNQSNLDTVFFEFSSFYHTKNPRKMVFVQPSDDRSHRGTFDTEAIERLITDKFPRERVVTEYKNWADVDDIDYLQNSDKCVLIFVDEYDQLTLLARYVAGLIKCSGYYPDHTDEQFRDMAADFVDKIIEADWMFNFVSEYLESEESISDVEQYCKDQIDDHGFYDNTFRNGANFSYDLLFYLNDHHRCSQVQGLIKEKFTIHAQTMVKDVMEHFTSRRHYMAYFLSVLDWMNANGYSVNKHEWVKDVYLKRANQGNYAQAFYIMEETWNEVKDDPAFIAAHQDKADADADGWEYMDLYTEFKNAFPIVRKVLQGDYDMDNLTADIKLINTDVQFFSKRQNRIPYLIHKYPL